MFMFRLINTYLIYTVLIAACATSAIAQSEATPVAGGISAGVVIKNQARATYQDPTGKDFVVTSPIVSITVVSVSGITVTPDDPQSSGVVLPNENVTRLFRACNTGNTPDTFTLTRSIVSAPSTLVAMYWDIDGSGTVTTPDIAITLNQTASPTIPAGDCIGILAVIDTGNVKLNDPVTIGITVKTNSPTNNGPQKDDGTIINKTGETAKITDPTNPSLPPIKLVENKDQFTSTAGSIVNYSISFRNRGSVPAVNVLLSDDLPAQIDYVPGTLKLGTTSLTDISDTDEGQVINNRRLEIKLPKVDPDQAIIVTFQAKLNENVIPGVGIINTAQVSGDNIGTAIRTSKTKVVINPVGTVYAGYSNGAVPISNAKVTLTTDKAGLNLLPVPTTGFDPNPTNSNPFMTDTQGHFSFTLGANQVGAPGVPVIYFVNVAAQGYRPRLVEIKIQPSPTNPDLYIVDVVSADGQPISQAGNFKLTSNNVSLNDIAAVVLNIPMFETTTLQLTKVADKQRAEIGEMISYRLEAQNSTAQTFTAVKLQDTLPLSFAYIPGTARVQVGGTPAFAIEPTITNNLMVFNIGDLAGGSRVTITYRLRVGANAKQGEQINSVVATGVYPNGDPITTQPAKAPVLVGLGQFSMRQIIIGRVFEDTNGNGLFEKCDRPVAGVRVYLNNGTSVITDSKGMYNFPSIEEGATSLTLDPFTVPRGYGLLDNKLKAHRSWSRLVRTPLGGGGLNRQNFVLEKTRNPITESVTDIEGGVETGAFAGIAPGAPGAPGIAPATPAKVAGAPAKTAAEAEAEKAEENKAKGKKSRKNSNAKNDVNSGGALDGVLSRARGPKTRAGLAAMNVGRGGYRAPGTYTDVSTDNIEPVAAGEIKVLSPEAKEVIMENALRVEARVHMDYAVALEVNGERIPDTNVGVKEIDKKNKIATYVYVGISLKPGPNELKVTAVDQNGVPAQSQNITVMGRGPVTRLEIVTDKKEIQSGGRDSTIVRVKGFDQWGNPAANGQVGIQVSAGRLLRLNDSTSPIAIKEPAKDAEGKPVVTVAPPTSGSRCDHGNFPTKKDEDDCYTALAKMRGLSSEEVEKLRSPLLGAGSESINGFSSEQVNATNRQQIVSIENGEALIELVGEGQPGNAEIRAFSGELRVNQNIRFTPEMRPQILVGLAEASFGKAAPDVALRGGNKNYNHHVEFFYRTPLIKQAQLTLAYNSYRALTRTAGRDRSFFLDPLDRVYPIFGDSSTRFEDAQSNSKLYARIDKGRSYAMFGDFNANQQEYLNSGFTPTPLSNLAENLASSGIGNSLLNNINSIPVFAGQGPQLTGYSRRLTGVKVHLESEGGSSITLTGARPDTAFSRDVFPGSTFGLIRLSHTDVLQGTETVVREVRDRRNPDIILQRETLVRSVDYNLDPYLGSIYFMRPLSAFDSALNLVQIVTTYEYRSVGMNSAVYTARGSKNFNSLGLRVGTSFVDQRQENYGSFFLGGLDIEKQIGKSGSLQFEWGMSNGRVASTGSYFGYDGLSNSLNSGNGEHNGNAFRAEYRQPLNFAEAQLQASFGKSDQAFYNPFGSTVSPGSQRGTVALDFKPRPSMQMRLGFTDERNKTATFNNTRRTGSVGLIKSFGDKLRVSLGYDYRTFTDSSGSVLANQANTSADTNGTTGTTPPATANSFAGRNVTSNLLTAGAEYRPTSKLQIAIKREQNVGDADPSYPNQTTIASSYQVSSLAKIFFTQRLASQAISAISDLSSTGFAETASRRETAIGVESPLSKYTTMSGRYQINNGINGTDSFAVIGLMNRFPLSKKFSLDAGYERGMHLKGNGQSFNNAMFGASYNPSENFHSAARYELRDLNGFGNIFTVGAAGKLSESFTTLGRFQYSRTAFQNQNNEMMNGQLAAAWRPLDSDRSAMLLSYTHRSINQSAISGFAPARDRDDILAADGLYQPFRRLELYGRYAMKFSNNGRDNLPLASTMTMLLQGRAELRIAKFFDVAGEVRSLWLSGASSRRFSAGAELGFWALSDLRLAGGYNFTRMTENAGYFGGFDSRGLNTRKGFYFVVSSKLSNMFNLFGTSRDGLVGNEPIQPATTPGTTTPAPENK
jgi:trimeric autotransporter adhesin